MRIPSFEELLDVKADCIPKNRWCAVAGDVVELSSEENDAVERSVIEALISRGLERSYLVSKRLLDIAISGVVLLMSLPLFVLIGAVIKLNSRGPAIFKQVRIGQNRRRAEVRNGHLYDRRNGNLKGRPFNMYKFRTMYAGVDNYTWKPKYRRDSRLTLSGRILRRLCLDELPQFVNVLKGDMSIVGPRPELPHIVQEYNSLEAQRLAVKPGITGPWQLKGSRKLRIHDNIHLDLTYIRRRSFWYDALIMFRTLLFVLTLRNV